MAEQLKSSVEMHFPYQNQTLSPMPNKVNIISFLFLLGGTAAFSQKAESSLVFNVILCGETKNDSKIDGLHVINTITKDTTYSYFPLNEEIGKLLFDTEYNIIFFSKGKGYSISFNIQKSNYEKYTLCFDTKKRKGKKRFSDFSITDGYKIISGFSKILR